MLQDLDRLLNIAALHEELAGHHLVVNAIGIFCNHVKQHALGIVDASHAEVGLRQTRETFSSIRRDLQSAFVSVLRIGKVTSQTGSVSEREPSSRVARRHLNGAFGVHVCYGGIVMAQGIVGSPLLPLNGNTFAKGPDTRLLRLLRPLGGTLASFLSRCLRLRLLLALLTANFKCLGRHGSDQGENQKESSWEHESVREYVIYVTALHHLCLQEALRFGDWSASCVV